MHRLALAARSSLALGIAPATPICCSSTADASTRRRGASSGDPSDFAPGDHSDDALHGGGRTSATVNCRSRQGDRLGTPSQLIASIGIGHLIGSQPATMPRATGALGASAFVQPPSGIAATIGPRLHRVLRPPCPVERSQADQRLRTRPRASKMSRARPAATSAMKCRTLVVARPSVSARPADSARVAPASPRPFGPSSSRCC
jgi:hypothetical protein